jgi:hypothetical protein
MTASFCKATVAASVACLALWGASLAHAETCSDSWLKGKYGQQISGVFLPGPGVVLNQNGVAMTDFDGKGKFTQHDFIVVNGQPVGTEFEAETGTYKVNSDCTGTATINYTKGSEIVLQLVVVDRGREFRTVVSYLTLGGNAVPANVSSDGVRVDDCDEGRK